MSVDYLTRFMNDAPLEDAFAISLCGAQMADNFGIKGSFTIAVKLLHEIKGLDDTSIANACKLTTFDAWFRNAPAMGAKNYKETNLDKETVENIKIMVNRSLKFFKEYGPVTKDGFTFEPVDAENQIIRECVRLRNAHGVVTLAL